MQRSLFLILFCVGLHNVSAQNKDTANVAVTNYKLVPGTYSWRGDGQFHDMTSWDSSPYLQGHLRQGTQFRMNYRLLLPSGHNPSYHPGYPLIVMLHGAGERGNCWVDNCYCPDPAACNPNGTPDPGTDPRFLNNDHNLVHGGSPHLSARNRAGTKLPDDPTLASNAFPGFVLFPQNTNQWRNTANPAGSDVSNVIRIVRLLSRQYNIDQDRIYIHGLSMGAQALLEALNYADWLFAAAAPMSPINFSQSLEYDSVRNIPFWIFQGGQDLNPKPAETEGMIRNLREKGASVRYSLYPNLGHGTWNTAYAEPDFFSWFLSKNKSNIHVDYGKPNVCGTTGEGATLVLPQGFPAYQWERDGVIITGATSYIYVATSPGVYRARYSRLSATPDPSQWNRWSDPVTVGEKSPEAPIIEQLGTNVLSDLNLGSVAYLKVPEGFETYRWFQNGSTPQKPLVQSTEDPSIFMHTGCTGGGPCVHSGQYTLITEGYDKCPSLPSEPVTILFGTHNTVTVPPAITGTPNNFTFDIISPTSVLLKWTDNSTNEREFEIWRRKLLNVPGEDFNKGWVMATITKEDVTMFLDTGVEPASTYYYKIRAVNNSGRSNYFPGNTQGNVNQNRVVTTPGELIPPTPPGNVIATTVAPGSVRVTWETSSDNAGVKAYYIYFDGDSISVPGDAGTYTLSSLPLNREINFTVKAMDAAGNLSAASNPSNAHTFVSGLYYKHSTGSWSTMAQMADTWVDPEFTGWVSTFSLQERTQEDYFNFEFTGFLHITTPGLYAFRTTSDDGSQLFLDNNLIVNNDGLHGNVTVTSADQNLSAGAVPVMVRYFEGTGGQTLTVQYRGPDTGNTWVNVAASALKSGTPPPLPIPPATPSNLIATASSMSSIGLTWTYDQQHIVVLGSSTAAGTGASSPESSWVNKFSSWLTTNTTGVVVTNLALGGFDTEDVLPTGDPQRNITKALSLSPDIIIVNLPSNDVANGIPVSTTMSNLQTLKSLATAQGVRIFFTTTQPRNFGSLTNREMLQQTATQIKDAFGAYAINIFDELVNTVDLTIKASYNFDGIHVNDGGHDYIFNAIKKRVLPYLISFEVQRSVTEEGPYSSIARTSSGTYADTDLAPDKTYYYRLRATTIDTVSQFTAAVHATTLSDSESPTAPGTPVLHRSGYATISITWPASTDNDGIAVYEIYANGVPIGTSEINAFQATDLMPETTYIFTVVAVDKSGNKSSASSGLSIQTSAGTQFFTQAGATQLNNLASWRTQGGIVPTSFSDNGQVFVIRHNLPIGGPWTVEGVASKVVVDNGSTLTISNELIDATIDIAGDGILNLTGSVVPKLGTLSATSTVNHGPTTVRRVAYGNLNLTATDAVFNFADGETEVKGNLTTASGVSLQGAASNTSIIALDGNLIVPGNSPGVSGSVAVALHLRRNGNQTMTLGADPRFFEIRKTGTGSIIVANSGAPFVLNVGSSMGGGLSIGNGTVLHLGNNSLRIRGAGTINTAGENGSLGFTGGNLSIESTSSQDHHLHFHATNNTIKRLDSQSSAHVFVHTPVKVTDALKVTNGQLHSDGNIITGSTAVRTANVEALEHGASISGDVKVQRHISETNGARRYLSASVDGTTVSNLQFYFPVRGSFTGASSGSTTPTMFVFDDPDLIAYPQSTNLPPYNNLNAPLERGRGYVAEIHNSGGIVMETTGPLYQGNVTLPLSTAANTGEGVLSLGGNPYASAIKWNTGDWTAAGIHSIAAVVRNTDNGYQYEYFDSRSSIGTALTGDFKNGVIQSGQAFWIRSISSSPSLIIHESAKVREDDNLNPVTPGHLRLVLSGGTRKDVAAIVISATASDEFERDRDGVKIKNNGMFNLSSLTSDNVSVAINHIGDEFCAREIGLDITDASPGTYSLSVDDVSKLSAIESVNLIDNFSNTTFDLSNGGVYHFSITADPLSSGASRFDLILSRSSIDLSIVSEVIAPCGSPATIRLKNTQPGATYGIYSATGVEIASMEDSPGGDLDFVIPFANLQNGMNSFVAKASLPGCSSAELPQNVSFEYYHAPVVTASDVTVCSGETATLSVASSSTNVTYEWYLDGVPVEGITGASLMTSSVTEELYYSVVAFQPNGCKGPEAFVVVSPLAIEEPVISQNGDLITVNIPNAHYEWFRNGVSVGSTTVPSFDFNGGGAYSVTVSLGGCSRTSGEFIVTGISGEANAEFRAAVYPNPVVGGAFYLRFTSVSQKDVSVTIIDIAGRKVTSGQYTSSRWSAPIAFNEENQTAPGVYFINVVQDGKRKILKLVIE